MYAIQCTQVKPLPYGEYNHVRDSIIEKYLIAIAAPLNGTQENNLHPQLREKRQAVIVCNDLSQACEVEHELERVNRCKIWEFKIVDLNSQESK